LQKAVVATGRPISNYETGRLRSERSITLARSCLYCECDDGSLSHCKTPPTGLQAYKLSANHSRCCWRCSRVGQRQQTPSGN